MSIPEGNRVDLPALKRDRDQLFAEAAAAESAGEELTLPLELWTEAAARQHSRLVSDPWEADISDKTLVDRAQVSGGQVEIRLDNELRVSSKFLLDLLNIPPERQMQSHTKRLAAVMRKKGFKGPKDFRFAGEMSKGYCKQLPTLLNVKMENIPPRSDA